MHHHFSGQGPIPVPDVTVARVPVTVDHAGTLEGAVSGVLFEMADILILFFSFPPLHNTCLCSILAQVKSTLIVKRSLCLHIIYTHSVYHLHQCTDV